MQSQTPGESGGNSRARLSNYLASAFAIGVSMISLSVAISSNRTQERLLAASVWPALEYGTGNRNDEGEDVISMTVGNSGVGPARLRSFQILYDGKPAPNAARLLDQCCGLGAEPAYTVTSGTRARVLKAGDELSFLRLPREKNKAEVWERFNQERFKTRVLACYCSVLDACWMMDSDQAEPTPVATCAEVPDQQEWSG
jgi:hypothetical protein